MKRTQYGKIILGEMDGKPVELPLYEDEPEISDVMDEYFRFKRRVRAVFFLIWLLIIMAIWIIYYFKF